MSKMARARLTQCMLFGDLFKRLANLVIPSVPRRRTPEEDIGRNEGCCVILGKE